jgi:hypothetical protein
LVVNVVTQTHIPKKTATCMHFGILVPVFILSIKPNVCGCACLCVPSWPANGCTDPCQTWRGGSSPPRNRSAGRRDVTSHRPDRTADFALKNHRKFGNSPIRAKLGLEVPRHPGIVLRVGAM